MLTPMRIIISILLLLCLGQAAALVYLLQRPPDCRLRGVVAHVTDGDTLTLDLGQTTRKIRLSEIDTPEKNQPYGAQAEQLLTAWVAGKAVRVRDEGPDKYGRTLGRVYLGEIDINAALVAYGSAWVYRQYSQDAPLITLEEQARAARRGLWALPADQQIPPRRRLNPTLRHGRHGSLLMPIKAENRHRYPRHWKQIRAEILDRARHRCEQCGVPNHVYRNRLTGKWTDDEGRAETWAMDGESTTYIVLTIAHLDHTPEHCDPANLRAYCQKCHLAYDTDHHAQTAYQTRRQHLALGDLFDHG